MRFQGMDELLGITLTPVLEPLTYQQLFVGYLFFNEWNSLIDLFLFSLSLGFILLWYKIFVPSGTARLLCSFRRVPTIRLKSSVSMSMNWRTSLIRYGLELWHSWCQLLLFLYQIVFSYTLIYFLYISNFLFLFLLFYFIFFSFSFNIKLLYIYIIDFRLVLQHNWFQLLLFLYQIVFSY